MVARSPRQRALRAAVALVAAVGTIAGVGVVEAGSAQASGRVSFSSAVPTWAKTANVASATSSQKTLEGEVFLSLRNRAGAIALATAVSTPSSSRYRQYVTPEEWISTYSPTQSTFDDAVAKLRAKGLTITGTPASRQYIVFRGTVATFNSAFATTMATYSVDGENLIAPSTTPSLSQADARGIDGLSLDQGRLLTKPASATRTDEASSSRATMSALTSTLSTAKSPEAAYAPIDTPCSSYLGAKRVTYPKTTAKTTRVNTVNCGYSPKQLRAAYGIPASAGVDQTVAIIDAYASPTIVSDVNSYSAHFAEPKLTSGQYTDASAARSTFTDKVDCGLPSGWQGEQTLDVQAIHAIAPQAKILYVGGFNCAGGLDIALSKILDQGLANIVSNSYGGVGEPTGAGASDYVTGEVNLQLQAAAQGVGLYFASGDDGDEKANTGVASPDFPASSPWVTAVGGTAMGIRRNGTRGYTVGWGNTLDPVVKSKTGKYDAYKYRMPGILFAGGAGGGRSGISAFTQPTYQAGAVTTKLAAGRRVSPDIAALADPFTGFTVGYRAITNDSTYSTTTFGLGVSGGTSLATPIAAAQVAIIQQRTGARLGFANPAFYSVAAAKPTAFVDVTPRSKVVLAFATDTTSYAVTLDTDSSLKTAVGYDKVTGLGELRVSSAQLFADPTTR